MPVRAAALPRPRALRRRRPQARRQRRRPHPLRRAAADRQVLHQRQEQPQADPLPARVLLPRLRRGNRMRSRRHGCNGYKKLTGLGGFAYHPYTRPNGPRVKEPSRDDATIRSVGRVTAHARPRAPQGPHRRRQAQLLEHRVRLPVSTPPDRFQTRALAHPRLHQRGRVDVVPQPARGELLAVHARRRPARRRPRPLRQLAGRPALRQRQAQARRATTPTACRSS